MKLNDVFKKYNPKAESRWRTWSDAEFLIAPQANKNMQKYMLEIFTLNEAMEFETKGPLVFADMQAGEAMRKIYDLYSKTILLDWKFDEKYSPSKGIEIMVENLDFANWVMTESQVVAELNESSDLEQQKK